MEDGAKNQEEPQILIDFLNDFNASSGFVYLTNLKLHCLSHSWWALLNEAKQMLN